MLLPKTNGPPWYPGSIARGRPRTLEARDYSGDQNQEPGQGHLPADFGEFGPTEQVTEHNRIKLNTKTTNWEPDNPVNTGGFGPSDHTPGQDQIGSENDACSSHYRHTLGHIYWL